MAAAGKQLDIFDGIRTDLYKDPSVVKAVRTSLGPFGNRVDLIVVTERNLGGASLLEPSLGVVHVDGQGIISRSK